eukprot:525036_1
MGNCLNTETENLHSENIKVHHNAHFTQSKLDRLISGYLRQYNNGLMQLKEIIFQHCKYSKYYDVFINDKPHIYIGQSSSDSVEAFNKLPENASYRIVKNNCPKCYAKKGKILKFQCSYFKHATERELSREAAIYCSNIICFFISSIKSISRI